MPTLSEKHKVLSGLNHEDAAAIVAVIELKTDEDVDKVLNKLDLMNQSFDARLDSMEKSFDAKFEAFDAKLDSLEKSVDAKFEAFDAKLDSMEKSVDARLDAMNEKIDTKINTLYWLVGLAVTVAIAAAKFL